MELDILVPVYKELAWLDEIIPNLLEILSLGAKVIIGLNFSHPEKVVAQYQHHGFKFVYQDEILSREAHWSKLIKSSESKYFHFWFAGDQIFVESLKMHLEALRKNSTSSFAFSYRGIKTPYGCVPFENYRRKRYWESKESKLSMNQFLQSILETGTNYIGEPSFVTFSRRIAPTKWIEGHGYAVELDYYSKALENGTAIFVPISAGFFGVGTDSASAELVNVQESDVIKWLTSKIPLNKVELIKVHKASHKRTILFKVLKCADNLGRVFSRDESFK